MKAPSSLALNTARDVAKDSVMETEDVKQHGRNKGPAWHGVERCWMWFPDSLFQAGIRAGSSAHPWRQPESETALWQLLPATAWQHSNKSTSQPGTAAFGELGMLLWRADCAGASVPASRREETRTRIMQTRSWTEQRILLMQAQAWTKGHSAPSPVIQSANIPF